MDEDILKQILDELYSSFEDSETHSAGLLLFLKDQGIASDEKLAPYFKQAANTSEVRWRAARVRMSALLASALKPQEPEAEKKTPAVQAKQSESNTKVDAKKADAEKAVDSKQGEDKSDPGTVDTKKANGQVSEPKSERSGNEAGDANYSEGAVENTKKSQDKNNERTAREDEAA